MFLFRKRNKKKQVSSAALTLGRGCSGVVTLINDEEHKWLQSKNKNIKSISRIVKKIFHQPGSEAVAEYYFSQYLFQRYPNLFVEPLHFIHAESHDRYDPQTVECYVFYMKEEPMKRAIELVDSKTPFTQSESVTRTTFENFRKIGLALYESGVIHNDLNLANLFLSETKMKCFDFGKSSFDLLLDEPLGKNFCTYYNAPELRKSNHYKDNLPDLWSLGVCMLVLFFPQLLALTSEKKISSKVFYNHVFAIVEHSKIESNEYLSFICKLLSREATKRPRIEQWLNDPLFTGSPVLTTGVSTRQNALRHLPWLNDQKRLTPKFVQRYHELLYRFLLQLYQGNKELKRRDPICILFGSFNLFLQYNLKKYQEDKNHMISDQAPLLPYIEACRGIVINLLLPTKRYETDKLFRSIQFLLLETLQYQVLLQPLESQLHSLQCDFIPKEYADICKIMLLYQDLMIYPLLK